MNRFHLKFHSNKYKYARMYCTILRYLRPNKPNIQKKNPLRNALEFTFQKPLSFNFVVFGCSVVFVLPFSLCYQMFSSFVFYLNVRKAHVVKCVYMNPRIYTFISFYIYYSERHCLFVPTRNHHFFCLLFTCRLQ